MDTGKTLVLFDFSNPGHVALWESVDDVVMGGVSSSALRPQPGGTVLFTGVVSLEQGGGFGSVRTVPGEYDLRAYSAIVLSIRGDGKRYKLNLTDEHRADGLLHQASFDTTAGQWTTVRIPFEEFQPRYRGQPVDGHLPLDPARIKTFGLMISDKQAGPFALEIAKIAAEAC